LLVSATESVSAPEVVQASDWLTEWLRELACDWLWVVAWLMVVALVTDSEWEVVSADPLLLVTPSELLQLLGS
jgi:hypothetical protein